MHTLRAVAALVAAGLVACSEAPIQAHDGDTATTAYDGPYAIDQVDSPCTPGTPDHWDISVHTEGWADHIDFSIAPQAQDTAGGTTPEEHPLDNVDYDPEGTWDQWAVTLVQVDTASELTPGATTEFGCADQGTLAFLAVMYQTGAPDTVADCAWWGTNAASRFGSVQGKTCTCMNPDSDCSH